MHEQSQTDDLADLIRSGDSDLIATEVYPAVRRMVRSVLGPRDDHLIETAAADAVLSACRHHASFRGEARATSWLYTIARRAAYRCLRREVATPCVSLDDIEGLRQAELCSAQPPQAGAADMGLQLLREAVPNEDWRAIWLLWNEPGPQRSHQEVALLTGYTPGSVAAILSKVRRLLRRADLHAERAGTASA